VEGSEVAPKGKGWVEFGGIFFIVAGLFNLVAGLVMLTKKSHFDNSGLLYSKLNIVGTIAIIAAVVQLIVAILILRKSNGGRIAGIVLSVIGITAWFMLIFVAPGMSIISVALYVFLIYGLTAHRDEFE
jgi:hypothetical protein